MFLVPQGVGVTCSPGVFEVSTQRGVSQPRAAVELVVFQLGEDAKALGVTFEVEKIAAFGGAHRIQPATPGGLLEPVAYGILAGVAEGWVADVMSQAR
ncbi:hypothetical protein D3C85_1679300 [compost metagenome]